MLSFLCSCNIFWPGSNSNDLSEFFGQSEKLNIYPESVDFGQIFVSTGDIDFTHLKYDIRLENLNDEPFTNLTFNFSESNKFEVIDFGNCAVQIDTNSVCQVTLGADHSEFTVANGDNFGYVDIEYKLGGEFYTNRVELKLNINANTSIRPIDGYPYVEMPSDFSSKIVTFKNYGNFSRAINVNNWVTISQLSGPASTIFSAANLATPTCTTVSDMPVNSTCRAEFSTPNPNLLPKTKRYSEKISLDIASFTDFPIVIWNP